MEKLVSSWKAFVIKQIRRLQAAPQAADHLHLWCRDPDIVSLAHETLEHIQKATKTQSWDSLQYLQRIHLEKSKSEMRFWDIERRGGRGKERRRDGWREGWEREERKGRPTERQKEIDIRIFKCCCASKISHQMLTQYNKMITLFFLQSRTHYFKRQQFSHVRHTHMQLVLVWIWFILRKGGSKIKSSPILRKI